MKHPCFVVGTDTEVGKTVVTCGLLDSWLIQGLAAGAVKPFSSGTRTDARNIIRVFQNHKGESSRTKTPFPNARTIQSINPWHYRHPLSPAIAAHLAGGTVTRREINRFLEKSHSSWPWLLIEGAGGLLSPLGSNYSARDLIVDHESSVILVAANRLGVLNHTLLSWEALPAVARQRAAIILVNPPKRSIVVQTNFEFLRSKLGTDRVLSLPWLSQPFVCTTKYRKIFGSLSASLKKLWSDAA